MRSGDPRFASFPAAPAESGTHPGVAQMRWYILQTAAGVLTMDEFLADFRRLHEAVERDGPPQFGSSDEARAIWDVLWAVEFCKPDPSQEEHPEDWYTPLQVLAIVQRAAATLGG